MKVVIFAGGFGTRMSEETRMIPKPMVEVGGRPLIWHIMNHYSRHGHYDFIILTGYKSKVIKEYFLNYRALNSNFEIGTSTGEVVFLGGVPDNWKATIIDTGIRAQTGDRLRQVRELIGDETFLCTYGDGLGNVDLKELVDFHQASGGIATLTTVNPTSRYGEISLGPGGQVASFLQKPKLSSLVNVGYFCFEPEVFNHICEGNVEIEAGLLMPLAEKRLGLTAFFHSGQWMPIDTQRELLDANKLWDEGNAFW